MVRCERLRLHKGRYNSRHNSLLSMLMTTVLVVTVLILTSGAATHWSLAHSHSHSHSGGGTHRCMHEEMFEQERHNPTGIHRQLQEKVLYSSKRWRSIQEEKASFNSSRMLGGGGGRRSIQQTFFPMRLAVRYIDDFTTDRVCRSAGQVCLFRRQVFDFHLLFLSEPTI